MLPPLSTDATAHSDLVGDEPATSLALLAQRLGLAPSPREITRRFAQQPTPGSLQALVAVAKEIGLVARGFRATPEALAGISLPAVVHLQVPQEDGDGATGFALLVQVSASGVVLEATDRGEIFDLSVDDFADVWTGVVMTFTRAEAAPASGLGARAKRAWHAFVGTDAEERLPVLARHLGLVLLTGAALAGGVRLALAGSVALGGAVAGWALLAALAALTSWKLLTRRLSDAAGRGRGFFDRLCGGGGEQETGRIDCNSVLASKWASWRGLELSTVGLAFFLAVLLVMALAGISSAPAQLAAYRGLALLHLAALPVAAFLIAVQIYPLRRLCPLCLFDHFVLFAGAGLGVLVWAATASGSRGAQLLSALPCALPFGLAVLFTVGVVVPLANQAPAQAAMTARLARISKGIWGALAEFESQPLLTVPPPPTPFLLGDPGARLRLDVLVDPACGACGPFLERMGTLVESHPAAVSVAVHLPTRPEDPPAERILRVAITAAGTIDAYRAVKEDPETFLALAGGGVDGILAMLGGAVSPGALRTVRAAQEQVEALSAAAGDATPTLLLGGRVWRGSVRELERLLVRHPEVLPAQPHAPQDADDAEASAPQTATQP